MSDINVDRALSSVQKSMEFEGFVIDEKLMDKGRKILQGKATSRELVNEYIETIKSDQHERQL